MGKIKRVVFMVLAVAVMCCLLSGCSILNEIGKMFVESEADKSSSVTMPLPDTSDLSESSAPESDDVPEPALRVNGEILDLVGTTNGELKRRMGTHCDSELYAGGLPAVYYINESGSYPYDYWLDGDYDRAYEAWIDAPKDGEWGMPSDNPFPDDFEIMAVFLYRGGYGIEDFFVGDAELNYDTVGECFGQFPDPEFEAAGGEGPVTNLVDFWHAEYSHDGFYLRVSYVKENGILIPSKLEIWDAATRSNF